MATKLKRQGVRATSTLNSIQTGQPEQVFTSRTSYSWTDSFSGVSLPYYRQIIRNGGNATTEASGERRVVQPATVQARYSTTSIVWPNKVKLDQKIYGSFVFSHHPSGAITLSFAKADAEARIKFLEKYRSTRQKFSSGTFLGELRETLHMIRRPASAIRNGLNAYHSDVKKRLRGVRTTSKKNSVVGSTWLEYQFGWLPLVHDISDAYDLLKNGVREMTIISSSFHDTAMDRLESSTSFVSGGGCQYRYNVGSKSTASVRYLGAVSAESFSPPGLADAWGFRLQDVLPTIWELIPYSFLVDYFTNIGEIVAAASEGKVTLAWGCKTSRFQQVNKIVGAKPILQPNTATATFEGACSPFVFSSSYTSFTRNRIAAVSVGVSDINFDIPGMSSKKWLNIAALASLRR